MMKPDVDEFIDWILENRPSFEFEGRTYYLVENDVKVEEAELGRYVRGVLAGGPHALPEPAEAPSAAPTVHDLVASVMDGKPARWAKGVDLTWWVDEATFSTPDRVKRTGELMEEATKSWNDAADGLVKFARASSAEGALFRVAFEEFEDETLAVAFFPYDPPADRVVFVGSSLFGGSEFSSVGILRHELGHVLGFRHEHIRPESPDHYWAWARGDGFDDAEPLTIYDKKSVMHYPTRPGYGTKTLDLTPSDIQGVRKLYGLSAHQVAEFHP